MIFVQFIRSIKRHTPQKPNGKTIIYMFAYGGRTWQASRQIRLLRKAGYYILALDFTLIFRHTDPTSLLTLMDEVGSLLESEKLITKHTTMLGVSLGGLVGLNMLRRYPVLNKLLVITGGDLSRVPTEKALTKRWKITRQNLAEQWLPVNMYSPEGSLKDRHLVMVLPLRDKVIDPDEVKDEIAHLDRYNDMRLISRPGGHMRTIVSETFLRPKRLLPVIEELAQF